MINNSQIVQKSLIYKYEGLFLNKKCYELEGEYQNFILCWWVPKELEASRAGAGYRTCMHLVFSVST